MLIRGLMASARRMSGSLSARSASIEKRASVESVRPAGMSS